MSVPLNQLCCYIQESYYKYIDLAVLIGMIFFKMLLCHDIRWPERENSLKSKTVYANNRNKYTNCVLELQADMFQNIDMLEIELQLCLCTYVE